MWKIFPVLFLLLVGCQYISPIGPAIQLGIYWAEGEAHKYYNTDQESTLLAVRASLEELEIPIVEEDVKEGVIFIRAGGKSSSTDERRRFERRSDDRFKIKIIKVKSHTSKVSIRANVFGDKSYCEMIYRHIDKQSGIKQVVNIEDLR